MDHDSQETCPSSHCVGRVLERLDRIEGLLQSLLDQRTIKDFYTTEEAARILNRAEFTVREWCRNGRIRAEKHLSGRGKHLSWVISHGELLRYQREGLIECSKTEPVIGQSMNRASETGFDLNLPQETRKRPRSVPGGYPGARVQQSAGFPRGGRGTNAPHAREASQRVVAAFPLPAEHDAVTPVVTLLQ